MDNVTFTLLLASAQHLTSEKKRFVHSFFEPGRFRRKIATSLIPTQLSNTHFIDLSDQYLECILAEIPLRKAARHRFDSFYC